MSKVTAPLLSFGASGAIAKTQVYATWRGIPYVRRYVIPANPRSVGQLLTRDIFANLELRWKQSGPLVREPWDRFAVGQKFVGRNAYIGKNITALRPESDMLAYIGSPGAKGGLPPTSMVVTGVAGGGLEVVIVPPTPPLGWTLEAAIASTLVDQAPDAAVADVIEEGEDLVTPYQVDFTGLPLVLHQVSAWLRWTKPDNSVAFGPSINDSGTPLA